MRKKDREGDRETKTKAELQTERQEEKRQGKSCCALYERKETETSLGEREIRTE